MDNPILVEVTRGGAVESRHRGSVSVLDADGAPVLTLGEVARPVFPRSAIKGLQALALMESGAAERFGLVDKEIALACASHNGEPEHVATATSMLRKAGRDGSCLECGVQWPSREVAWRELVASGEQASALHNNCSGKHSGFVCFACAEGEDPAGYIRPEHPVQQRVRDILTETTGAVHGDENRGTDGCSIPTWAVPLPAMALAFARFGTGHGFGPRRAAAAARIREAVAAEPFQVAGTGRIDTDLMKVLGARVFMKTGAEGVYCASLPEMGFGIALKIDDGNGRAAEVAIARLIERFLTLNEAEADAVGARARPTLKNWNRMSVGDLRPADALG